jgi:hypothetical protein
VVILELEDLDAAVLGCALSYLVEHIETMELFGPEANNFEAVRTHLEKLLVQVTSAT